MRAYAVRFGQFQKITCFRYGYGTLYYVIAYFCNLEDWYNMADGAMLISTATQRNWGKLKTKSTEKLKSRANKSRSEKFVIPDNYMDSHGIESLMEQVYTCTGSIQDIFYSLCLQKLSFVHGCPNYERFVAEYGENTVIPLMAPTEILSDLNKDWLGFLYQMKIPEGQRNLQGQYYTNAEIVRSMMSICRPDAKAKYFDPCCGTGIFLMNAGAGSLSQLFGVDNDPVAVMIAKANLIALFPEDKQYPQVYCEDYLDHSIFSKNHLEDCLFDYIFTNPPWGISKVNDYSYPGIVSRERSSLFFAKAFSQLKAGGVLSFLLPSSLLKIKTHCDIRSFILHNTQIEQIALFSNQFNGVFTDFFSITVSRNDTKGVQSYRLIKENKCFKITMPLSPGMSEIELNESKDQELLAIIEQKGHDTLDHSIWALGIVTGDNKNKLQKTSFDNCEEIYIGKDIMKYLLKKPSNYLLYDRSQLQQCAKDEYYRCQEKLVYRFISKNLCFAYDNSGSLFLNSANILIPSIDGMSVKTVLAFLNSEVFAFYYTKKFTDIKVLKSNLMALPFPKITDKQNIELSGLVDRILQGEKDVKDLIDNYIYSLYGFSDTIVKSIKQDLYGNID